MIKHSFEDKVTLFITLGTTILFIIFVLSLLSSLIWHSFPSIKRFNFTFLTESNWNYKFLEISDVKLNNPNIELLFTTPLSEKNNIPDLVKLSSENKNISYTYSITNYKLILIPQVTLSNNTYEIQLSQKLLDKQNNKAGQIITWTGKIHDIQNNQLQTIQIIGSKSGIMNQITNENERHYGILAFIIGTIVSSLLSLVLTFPMALASALLLTEYLHPKSQLANIFTILVDLLAGIPSIIYGLWGLFFLVPRIGANLLTASIILAIMITPYAASLIRESISLVPQRLRHAGLSLGASHYQITTKITLPYAKSGIIAGILLSLGRALGETLAVTMVIGNRNQIPKNIFSPAQTIASLIANEYGEASGLKQSALIEAGLVLILITLLFSLLGRFIISGGSAKNSTK